MNNNMPFPCINSNIFYETILNELKNINTNIEKIQKQILSIEENNKIKKEENYYML